MHKESVALLGGNAPVVRSHDARSRTIYRFTVCFHPLTHFRQALQGHSRQFTIWLRTDVHQEIGILARRFHQIMNQGFGGFIVLIGYLISPHPVHGFAGFQRQFADVLSRQSRLVFARQITLEHLEILSLERHLMMIIAYHTGGLQPMNQRILFRQLPVEIGIDILIPPAIKPYCAYLAIMGEQFGKLVVHKLVVTLPVTLRIRATGSPARSSLRSILSIPVDV